MTGAWIERHTEKPPLTLNVSKQSKVTWLQSREIKDWRTWAAKHATETGIAPIVGPVEVTVIHLRRNRIGWPDVGAPILAAKAVIDGLVDAHVLPSDRPEVVTRLIFEAPEVCGHHGLRLIIRQIEQHATRDQPSTGQISLLAQQDPGGPSNG